jgi:23S rRNA (guanosine2251-2'-O)-methyltransferase
VARGPRGKPPRPSREGQADRRPTGRSDRGPGGRRDERSTGRAGRPPGAPGDQLEGRNVVIAALTASDRVKLIHVDGHSKPSPKLQELFELAASRGARVESVPRSTLDAVSEAGVHNGVIAWAEPLPRPTLKQVIDALGAHDPLFLLLDEVQYEQNLGAILRTAAWAGADAVIVPTRRGADLGPVVQRVAMGGAEEVPVVREGLMSALATLRRAGVRIVGAEADGDTAWCDADLTGPLALVMGGEDHGLGHGPRSKCDAVLRIPGRAGSVVTSLNVSVTAGLLLAERLRQTRPWDVSS